MCFSNALPIHPTVCAPLTILIPSQTKYPLPLSPPPRGFLVIFLHKTVIPLLKYKKFPGSFIKVFIIPSFISVRPIKFRIFSENNLPLFSIHHWATSTAFI